MKMLLPPPYSEGRTAKAKDFKSGKNPGEDGKDFKEEFKMKMVT